eukprot:gene6218-4476_t
MTNTRSLADLQQEISQLDDRYVLQRIIGAGSYGMVIRAKDTADGDRYVAIKRVNKEIFDEVVLAKRILREIQLLAHFNDENIIGLRNILTPKDPEGFDHFYIVMDIMETDLKQVLRTLRALHVIHSAGVIHRDITPANILVNSNCDLKICDFGLAKEESDHGEYMTDYVTMRWYRAPELVMEDKNYSAKIDVWGIGCILAELLGSRPLFQGKDRVNQLDKIVEVTGTPPEEDIDTVGSTAARKYLKKKTPYPPPDWRRKYPNASKEAIDLLQRMLVFHPHKRISVLEAMRHPFLKNLHEDSDDVVNVPPFRYEEPNHKNVHEVKRAIYNASVRFHETRGASRGAAAPRGGAPSVTTQGDGRSAQQMNAEHLGKNNLSLATPLFATLSSNLLFPSDLLLLVPTSKTISHHSLGLHSNMQLRQGRFFPLPQVHLSDNTHIQFLTCEVYTNKRKTRETNSIDALIFNILELTLQQEVLRARGKLTTTMSTMKCYVSEVGNTNTKDFLLSWRNWENKGKADPSEIPCVLMQSYTDHCFSFSFLFFFLSFLFSFKNLFFITTIVLESYLRCSGRNDRFVVIGIKLVCHSSVTVTTSVGQSPNSRAGDEGIPAALQMPEERGGDEKWGQTALEYIYQQNHTVDPGKRQHDVASERRASTAFDRLLSVNETVLELRMGRLAERMTEALEVLQQLGLQETLDEATMLNGEQPPANYRRPSLTPPTRYPPVTRLTDPLEFSGAATTFPYVPPHEVEDLTHNTAQLLERQSGELREAAPTTGVEGEGFAARLALEQKALARQALILELAADPSFKESYNSDETVRRLELQKRGIRPLYFMAQTVAARLERPIVWYRFFFPPGTIVPTSAPIISDTVIQRLTGRLRRHKESRSDLLTLPTRIRLVVPSAIGSLHPCIAASNPRLDPVQDVDPSPALWASSYFDLLDLRGEWERRREKASTPSSFREQLVRNGWAVQVESREPPSSAPAGCPTLQAAIRSIPEKLEGETSKQYAERCWMRFQNAVGDHPLILALDRYAALIARGELSVPAACWALLCDSSSSDVVVYIRSHAVDLEKEVTATAGIEHLWGKAVAKMQICTTILNVSRVYFNCREYSLQLFEATLHPNTEER